MKPTSVNKETIAGTETVLLVDDEEMIIDVAQAIEVLEIQGSEIDLVLLGLVMPDMDGETTFENIRTITPSMPVILWSGYSKDGQASKILQKGCNGFIQKPFNMSEISQAIRRALDEEFVCHRLKK